MRGGLGVEIGSVWGAVLGAVLLAGCASDGRGAADTGSLQDTSAQDAQDTQDTGMADTGPTFADRVLGARAPLSAECDHMDPLRCQLPWPSNVFTVVDADTVTGLRLQPVRAFIDGDSGERLTLANGFSRVSTVLTAFAPFIDGDSAGAGAGAQAQRLVILDGGGSQDRAGSDDLGARVPLRIDVRHNWPREEEESVMLAYPRGPLKADHDYVAVVLKGITYQDGGMVEAEPKTAVVLGLRAPEDDDERALAAYHAPTRQVIAAAGIAPEDVLRVWDFTTRSADDPREYLNGLRDLYLQAVRDGNTTIEITEVDIRPEGDDIAMLVHGVLRGLPLYLNGWETDLSRGYGTRPNPFRVLVPRVAKDYRVTMYGHGAGGDVRDTNFDDVIADYGAAKVNIEIEGWSGDTVAQTAVRLAKPVSGSEAVAAYIAHSLAGGMAIQESLDGELGALLRADTIGGKPNPMAGIGPDTTGIIWSGGSLGGATGMTYSLAEPRIHAGVLAVPAAGWTQFLPYSILWTDIFGALAHQLIPSEVGILLNFSQAQTHFDMVDGAAWADAREDAPMMLIQESVGDPVLPNLGTELVATSLNAVQVGAVLDPIVGVEAVEGSARQTAITQYWVDNTGAYDVHGMPSLASVPGQAARQQIIDFVASYWAGDPTISVPALCMTNTPPGSCDFRTRDENGTVVEPPLD